MMTRASRILVVTMLATAPSSCGLLGGQTISGSGDAAEETRDVGSFTEVSLSVPGMLLIEQGEQGRGEGMRIEGDDNLLEHLEIEVRGEQLVIQAQDRANLRPDVPLRFHVRVPELRAMRVTGGGAAELRDFQADALDLEVAGSGVVTAADLSAGALTMEVAGSGRIEAWGSAERQSISIAGSGDVHADDLYSREARVDIAGSGSISLQVSDELEVRIAGSGSVHYSGDPHLSTSISGSGRVRKVD